MFRTTCLLQIMSHVKVSKLFINAFDIKLNYCDQLHGVTPFVLCILLYGYMLQIVGELPAFHLTELLMFMLVVQYVYFSKPIFYQHYTMAVKFF